MPVPKDILMKFPAILRKKLLNNEIAFVDDVKYKYDDICAYRCVTRKKDDNSPITINDFKSPAELGRTNIKGVTGDITKIPEYYGTSLYENKAQLELRLHLPQKTRKIAKGNIYCEGGPILKSRKDSHICWWLYEDADISSFKLGIAKEEEVLECKKT